MRQSAFDSKAVRIIAIASTVFREDYEPGAGRRRPECEEEAPTPLKRDGGKRFAHAPEHRLKNARTI